MNGVYVNRAPGFIDAYDIWFVYDDAMRGKRKVARFEPQESGPARLEWQEVAEGVASEPTLRLGGAEVEALRRGLDENGPTTQDGLTLARDAIKVRDRLLTLVEKLAGGDK